MENYEGKLNDLVMNGLVSVEEENGLYAVELDFCGDNASECAMEWSYEFDLKVKLFEKENESPNGFPVYKFWGNAEGIVKMLEVYGI